MAALCGALADPCRQAHVFRRILSLKSDVKAASAANGGLGVAVPEFFANNLKAGGGDRLAAADAGTGEALTWAQVDRLAWAYASWCADVAELLEGGVVALFARNCVQYTPFWLGAARAGCRTALVNTNLAGVALRHCLKLAFQGEPGEGGVPYSQLHREHHVVCSPELCVAASDAVSHADLAGLGATVWSLLPPAEADGELPASVESLHGAQLEELMEAAGRAREDRRTSASKDWRSTVLYIYTSGTTGMPKAARITHARVWYTGVSVAMCYDMRRTDVLYTGGLPLFHTIGAMSTVGACWARGCAMVLRRKFSARSYMKDCVEHKATVGFYIGELLRYMLAVAPSQADTAHTLRVLVGNGARPEIWAKFRRRFKVVIGELYGATEGNSGMSTWGFDVEPGVVGYIPPVVAPMWPIGFFKVDAITGELVRDRNGRCVRCAPGEPGELLGKIAETPDRAYEGYTDPHASNAKVAEGVVTAGDRYFRTGDLLSCDRRGYARFVDRLGDTFRWKGENVSTMEVAAALGTAEGVLEANVYGVEVPGYSGRAGMAAIVVSDKVNSGSGSMALAPLVAAIYEAALALPAYARPLFLRIVPQLETTGTFKQTKTELRAQGYDKAKCGDDPLFFLDGMSQAYIPLNKVIIGEIKNGEVRL